MMRLPWLSAATHDEALDYIRKHKADLCEQFANDSICPSQDEPFSLFMAGSPGAGKTEFSKTWLKDSGFAAVRIDVDEIRDFLPMYDHKDANSVHAAACVGMERLYDYVLKKNKSVIMDATFTPYNKVEQNVERSLSRGRHVEIIYIFQEPLLAWEYTQKREALEGRIVPKEVFVDALFEARENVKKIKRKYPKIVVTFVYNDFSTGIVKSYFNINEIDKRTEIPYSKEELVGLLP